MAFYEINLVVLIVLNIYLYLYQHKESTDAGQNAKESGDEKTDHAVEKRSFISTYLTAYLLATAADWLQVASIVLLPDHADLKRVPIFMRYIATTSNSKRRPLQHCMLLDSYLEQSAQLSLDSLRTSMVDAWPVLRIAVPTFSAACP